MIDLYFGKVVDVKDDEQKNRLRISIPGFTDKIPTDQLPWYFPFYGQAHIPIVNDTVPVFILNGNFTHGFYNHKIDLAANGLSGTEYENYVELYKRLGIEMYFKESEGWQIKNKNTFLNIKEKLVHVLSDKIQHNSGAEPMVLGDTLMDILSELIDAILALTVQTGVGPSSTPINASQFTTVKGKLPQFKSKKSFLE